MKSRHLIIASIILFGSLWGLAELGIGEAMWARSIPRAPILTAIGVLFIVLGRRVWAAPGSTLTLTLAAAAFKFLQHPFWGCKVAAVLMVGVIFEIGFTLVEGRQRAHDPGLVRASRPSVLVLSPVLTLVSFVAFSYFARDVLQNPYWAMPDKFLNYMLVQGPVAAVLALPAAWAGLAFASRLNASSGRWDAGRVLAYRIAAAVSGLAGVAAALALRY
jgi:hypothetical protein